MPASFDEWSDQHWERAFARQTSQADAAKLLVTFALALAGTMVATALQVAPQNKLDLAASIVLGGGFLLTVGVFLMDRLKWPDRRDLLQDQQNLGWSHEELLANIRMESSDFENYNDKLLGWIKRCTEFQLLVSSAAATLAVISLFQ